MDFTIRKFIHRDVEDFIRLATSAFADEWLAEGMTPEGFARQIRQIFRWNMIPFRLLTALVGIQWEAFVAEVNGHIVGGGMYMGRKKRMNLEYLMVEPAYRRQGIGQALLVKRLERLTELGIPFVMAQELETNQASLGNLHKQGFVEYQRTATYKHSLPLPAAEETERVINRLPKAADRAPFQEIQKRIMAPFVRYNSTAENVYFPSPWRKLYLQFLGSQDWPRAFDVDGATVGFLAALHDGPKTTGLILHPTVAPENARYFPTMIHQAATWLETLGLDSVNINVPEQFSEITAYLQNSGWTKEYTWIHLVKWLDDKARQEFREIRD